MKARKARRFAAAAIVLVAGTLWYGVAGQTSATALAGDSSVVAWGRNDRRQATVPPHVYMTSLRSRPASTTI